MKWIYNNTILLHPPVTAYGFIYKITEIATGRIYIGKKNFYKNDNLIYQSDWRTYKTSSVELKSLIQKDPDDFIAEVLDFGKTSKQLSYLEMKYQLSHEVLETNSYKKCIGGKYFKKDI